jgi:hypothetical protein
MKGIPSRPPAGGACPVDLKNHLHRAAEDAESETDELATISHIDHYAAAFGRTSRFPQPFFILHFGQCAFHSCA